MEQEPVDEILEPQEEVDKDLEWEWIMEGLQGKSKNTIASYRRAYNSLYAALGKQVHTASQKLIMQEVSKTSANLNTQASLLNIAIIVRRKYKLDVKELEKQRVSNKKGIAEHTTSVNQVLDLPTVAEFDAYIEELYKDNRYNEYVINYLLRHLCCRNADLYFDLVDRKAKVKKEGNVMYVGRGRATFYRRDYKTDKTYGEKVNVFVDKKFASALKRIKMPLIPTKSQIGYYVKKMSFRELGEGALMKMMVNGAREKGDLNRLSEISRLRGTDLCTIASNYNIQVTPK